MFEGLDTVVIRNELAYADVLPVEWQPLAAEPNPSHILVMDEANVQLLKAHVAIEERRIPDKGDELEPLASEIARLDFKLNLVLQMLETLVARDKSSDPVPVRFNALGASWQPLGGQQPIARTLGILKIRLRSSIPQTLDLLGHVSDSDEHIISVAFTNLSQPVRDLIQRLCFLRHRKQVAGRKANDA